MSCHECFKKAPHKVWKRNHGQGDLGEDWWCDQDDGEHKRHPYLHISEEKRNTDFKTRKRNVSVKGVNYFDKLS